MEQQTINALERIDNPILIILIVVLLAAVVALWYSNKSLQNRLMEALIQNIAAISNINSTLANFKEQIEELKQP